MALARSARVRPQPGPAALAGWLGEKKGLNCFLAEQKISFVFFCKKTVKTFFSPGQGHGPGPMDQGRTWAQAGAHGPGPDPGPMGQGHGPGPGPMDRAIISEAAKAADFKGGCGGAEPPHMKKVQTFFRPSKQSWDTRTQVE